ncbi:type IV toxin-antitoxin system AbiEi family antitoxin domain-containing protein [Peribacillus castrilensis]|uniref:type IV toxin-antitoxin system AbiEi family antitoxin domain-containing protein n=1 Tax=Peribacillus TaxID=2675229 RepID=UPI0035D0E8B4
MPRLSRFLIIQNMIPKIVNYLTELNQNIFSLSDLQWILSENRTDWTIPKITTANEFIGVLIDKGVLEEVIIKTPQRNITKYTFEEASPYAIAVSLRQGSYLSHYSAIFTHQLTENVPKTIYTNLEQSPKYGNDEEMEQKDIDLAFSRPMRLTNQIATFKLKEKEYKVYLLNGKNQKQIGVEKIESFNLPFPVAVTNVERTLIDIVVRPIYSGGVEEVLQAFREAKGTYSVNRLLSYLKKMDFKYPYHQLIGFYLEKADYEENVLNLLNKFEINYNFYLSYQISEKDFSERWRVFYPKGL